jgi:hypothetical protein
MAYPTLVRTGILAMALAGAGLGAGLDLVGRPRWSLISAGISRAGARHA